VQLITSKEIWQNEEVLLCPQCELEYIHPVSVKVATKTKLFSVDSEGLTVARDTPENSKAKSSRGVRIFLEYNCENGHHGYIIFQFHKGNTFVEHEKLPDTNEVKTIWRD
jgi:hypothetical protein